MTPFCASSSRHGLGAGSLRKIENHRLAKTLVGGVERHVGDGRGQERRGTAARSRRRLHDWRESRKLSSRITAARRSTALARFSMLTPLSRSTRWACTVVRRSSHKLNRYGSGGLEARAKLAGVLGAASFVPAHVQRIAHQYQCDVVVGSQFRQARQILANVGALEGFQALRGDAEFVAERQSDAPFAQIEGQDSA